MQRRTLQLAWLTFGAALITAPAFAADSDAEFAKAAATGGIMEVELGRHASRNAASPAVREFGEMMVSDHGKANRELEALAKSEGIALPAAMEEEQRKLVEKLSKLDGSEFDEAYVEAMVEKHEATAEAFRDQAEEEKSALDRWAAKTLPTIETHLTHAKTLEKELQARGVGAGNTGTDAGRALDPSVTGTPGHP
jgi:putative membrane protein